MKLLLLVCVLVVASAISESEMQAKFSLWAGENHKVYPIDQVFTRYNIFRNNMKFIEDVNHDNRSYKLAMNEFGDMTLAEFIATHARAKPNKPAYKPPTAVRDVPESIDWRTKGAVTPIKDQGQCGSCWAFAAIAAIESRCWIKHHPSTIDVLSEQELVDCSGKYGNEGCNGGWMDQAFHYVQDNGGCCTEKEYPYKAYDQKCQAAGKKKWCKLTGWTDVKEESEADMKVAVADGPIAVAIEADSSVFQFYSSGVLDSSACGTELDHGVAVVGYGTMSSKPMWIVKNSWGKAWGSSGYVYIGRHDTKTGKGICGIAEKPSYPIIGDHE